MTNQYTGTSSRVFKINIDFDAEEKWLEKLSFEERLEFELAGFSDDSQTLRDAYTWYINEEFRHLEEGY